VESRFLVKVYYEDTDCGGVTYHASYIRFLERARTEWVAAQGHSIVQWRAAGYIYAVYHMDITYRRPARLCDELVVTTRPEKKLSEYRLVFRQQILRGNELLIDASIQVVCLNNDFGVQSFPDELMQLAPST